MAARGPRSCRGRPEGLAEPMGELLMAEVRYALRVAGRVGDVGPVARREGWGVATEPVRTVLRGPLPDQAALFGILAWARRLGLELLEVRRLPQASASRPPREADAARAAPGRATGARPAARGA